MVLVSSAINPNLFWGGANDGGGEVPEKDGSREDAPSPVLYPGKCSKFARKSVHFCAFLVYCLGHQFHVKLLEG